MYIKKVKKSIYNICKIIAAKVKEFIHFIGRTCVFVFKKIKEAIFCFGKNIAVIAKKIAVNVKEAVCHIGRIIIFAFLKTVDAICYVCKKISGFAVKIAERIVYITEKISKRIAGIAEKTAVKIKDSMHPVSRTDIFVLAVLLIVIITPIIVNMFFKLEAKSKQVNLYLSASGEELFGKDFMETLMREFEEKNPDIHLKFANIPAAAEPDVLFFNEGDFSALIAANALTELNAFTEYDSGAKQMAIPLVSFMDMLFYNIDILSAAGFDHPPKTRDEFLTYAKAVSRGDSGAAGYALSLSRKDRQALARDVFSWIWASGGSLFSEDEDGVLVLTKVPSKELSFFGVLNKEELLAPDVFETTGEERLEAFVQGKTAMIIASTAVIPYLREKMGDNAFGVTTIPVSGTGGKYTVGVSSVYVGISANTAYPESAWSFLSFLAGKSNLLCEKLNAVPGMVSNIIPGDYVRVDPFYSKAWEIFEASIVAESLSVKPETPEYENNFLEELKTFFEK
jgi:ABC-type glycerol-3-phosphate transport system substrate-binding protein